MTAGIANFTLRAVANHLTAFQDKLIEAAEKPTATVKSLKEAIKKRCTELNDGFGLTKKILRELSNNKKFNIADYLMLSKIHGDEVKTRDLHKTPDPAFLNDELYLAWSKATTSLARFINNLGEIDLKDKEKFIEIIKNPKYPNSPAKLGGVEYSSEQFQNLLVYAGLAKDTDNLEQISRNLAVEGDIRAFRDETVENERKFKARDIIEFFCEQLNI